MKRLAIIASGLLVCLSLQGCVPIFIGAAAGAVYYNRKEISQGLTDAGIDKAIYKKIEADPNLRNGTHIIIATSNRNVLLAGQTPFASQRFMVEKIARNTKGVRRIYNELKVSGPSSSLVRSSDALITSKIKTQLLLAKDVDSRSFKVVTEDGVVYLMGNVSKRQEALAVSVVRQVGGVQKVVTLITHNEA